MTTAGAGPERGILPRLHTQLNILVTVLTLDGNDTELATMFAGLADTAASAEPLLAGLDPVVFLEIRSALTHVRLASWSMTSG